MKTSTVKLGEVAEFIRGITFKPKDVLDLNEQGAIGCMRTKNVQTKLDLSDVWGINKSFVKNEKQILKEGDILISSANSWNLVGKGCWIPKLDYECTFGGFVTVLRVTNKTITSKFLFNWYIKNDTQELLRSFGQKTTNISNLNIQRCLDLSLPLPSVDQQNMITNIIDKTRVLEEKHEQAKSEILTIRDSVWDKFIHEYE